MVKAKDTTSEADWFGFEQIDPDTKQNRVRDVFDSVAGRYDIMNDVMSLGIHRIWKKQLLDLMQPRDNQTLLDVAGGTGDVALEFVRRCPTTKAIVCDINTNMVPHARDRAIDAGVLGRLHSVVGDAQCLPVQSGSMDSLSIAFGLRNVPRIDTALKEFARVLKPGGKFFCLEFSHVDAPGLKEFYDAYSFKLIPLMGEKIANDRESYQYLVESIRKFPRRDDLAKRVQAAGFASVRVTSLNMGIAAIHYGWRI